MANDFLIRARKAEYPTQQEFGKKVADELRARFPDRKHFSISGSYAQKKASLWESGQLIPTPDEFQLISGLLHVSLPELKNSFSVGVLPSSAADFFRALAVSPGEGLIASCFTGRVTQDLFAEDEEALKEALANGLAVAIFFPFPLESAVQCPEVYTAALTQQHRRAWRTVVSFWKMVRALGPDSETTSVKLYRPRVSGANVLFPPMFHRSTLLCKRYKGRTKVDLYTWTQGRESGGLFKVGGRSIESSEEQAEYWELFFGDVYESWSDTGELPDGDTYWQAYTGQSEPDAEQ